MYVIREKITSALIVKAWSIHLVASTCMINNENIIVMLKLKTPLSDGVHGGVTTAGKYSYNNYTHKLKKTLLVTIQ